MYGAISVNLQQRLVFPISSFPPPLSVFRGRFVSPISQSWSVSSA